MPQSTRRSNEVCECGHRPVCHRRGPCEALECTGWMAVHNRFTKEAPCTCTKYRRAKPKKATSP